MKSAEIWNRPISSGHLKERTRAPKSKRKMERGKWLRKRVDESLPIMVKCNKLELSYESIMSTSVTVPGAFKNRSEAQMLALFTNTIQHHL